jgi:lysophospholipid acyltransferase (LPLAT)-like uncharacterized protein
MKTILVLLALFLLASCAPDHVEITACVADKPDGFLMGLWHGMIAIITFVISLFSDSVEMYSVNNNGGWYNFGFLIGAGIIFGGSSKASSR